MNLVLRPWRLYADGSGRSTIAEFWLFYAIKYGVLLLPFFILGVITGESDPLGPDGESMPGWLMAFVVIWMLASFVPSLMLTARRLHDANLQGALLLTTFIPYLGFIALIVFGVLPGTRGENDYGFDPRQPDPFDADGIFD